MRNNLDPSSACVGLYVSCCALHGKKANQRAQMKAVSIGTSHVGWSKRQTSNHTPYLYASMLHLPPKHYPYHPCQTLHQFEQPLTSHTWPSKLEWHFDSESHTQIASTLPDERQRTRFRRDERPVKRAVDCPMKDFFTKIKNLS